MTDITPSQLTAIAREDEKRKELCDKVLKNWEEKKQAKKDKKKK